MNTNEVSGQAQEQQTDMVLVIDRAGHIESLFNQIISDYCAPREHAKLFMWMVVLDTSVMPLGSKQKVVMAVANEMKFKLPKDALIKVIQLRNSFAHNTSDANTVISVGPKPEDAAVYNVFWTLDPNGVLKESKRNEAFDSFNKSYEIAKVALLELLRLIKEQRKGQEKWVADRMR